MSDIENNKRIAKNTLMLYFRQILTMLVSLYTARIVLRVLGVVDYGVNNVVAGIVSMFGFLSSSMATASQRFFSFELGRKNSDKLEKIFSINIEIYFLISMIVLILAETIGLWFVNFKLIIPIDRMDAARLIYQFSILSFLLTIMTTPYIAVIISRENMDIYAYVSIVEAVLKLVIVLALKAFNVDKLKLYGFLLLLVTLINSSLYIIYCRRKYPESRFSPFWDQLMFRKIFSFAGWNLIGSSSGIVKNQIINILLNIYFGPVVNAARGIASQVNSAVVSFSVNFTTAVRPQIIKLYAAGKKDEMIELVFRSSKATFYLMFIFVLPLELEMPAIINLWLGQTPPYVVLFTRLVLIDALIDSISYPLMTAAQATGKIKLYQVVVGILQLMNLPVSYLLLSLGAASESVLIVGIIITSIAFIVRLIIVKKLIGFSINEFFIKVLLPVIIVCFVAPIVPILYTQHYDTKIIHSFVSIIFCLTMTLLSILVFGVTKIERKYILSLFQNSEN